MSTAGIVIPVAGDVSPNQTPEDLLRRATQADTKQTTTTQHTDKTFVFSVGGGYQVSWMCNMNGNHDFNQLKWFLANASNLVCCGFMRRYLSNMSIADIATIVSLYFAHKFNDNLPILFDINHQDNEIIAQNNILQNYGIEYQMNRDNFKQYCKLLTNTNVLNIKSIHFGVGLNTIDGRKTVIISPQIQVTKNFTEYFIFKHNEINAKGENYTARDWWVVCYKRLILYLEKITNHEMHSRKGNSFIDIEYTCTWYHLQFIQYQEKYIKIK